MDQRERLNDAEEALRVALQGFQAGVWTALPGILQSYDATALTCTVQPSIQGQLRQQDGSWKDVNLPILLDCPVIFMGGGAFTWTFPLTQGDEGLVVFSSRCIDAWWYSGGVQKQARARMHDLSDGFFLPKVFSQPRKLLNVNTEFPELRSTDGSIKFAATATGFKVFGTLETTGNLLLGGEIVSPGGGTYTGDLQIAGKVTQGVGTDDQVTLGTHGHPALNAPPTPGS
jgi:hypothetical protein